MSQTSYSTFVPLREGMTYVGMPSTARSGASVTVDNTNIRFSVGPDHVGAELVSRRVLVQSVRKKVPAGFKRIGRIRLNGKQMGVFVEFLHH